jgi:DNA-binding transcriptional MocR family regulator
MHHFFADRRAVRALRLSVSAVGPAELREGLDRLASLIRAELAAG